jgi:uncharacterized protein
MARKVRVTSAGFAPVKGMRHLAQERVALDEQGVVGDRDFCLVDAERPSVLRTVQNPTLLAVVARTDGDTLSLTLPTGESVAAPAEPSGETLDAEYWGRPVELSLLAGPHAAFMSAHLGRDVRLAAAPRGGVVFGSGVTIVGTASLQDLAERTGRPGLVDEVARFRPTLVVETDEPYVEDTWLGEEVEVGEARLRVGGPIPRCAVVDHHPVTGEKDARLLEALVSSRPRNSAGEPVFGVYAECVRPGAVSVVSMRRG